MSYKFSKTFHAPISRADAELSSLIVCSALPHTGSCYTGDDTASPSLPQRACDHGYNKRSFGVRSMSGHILSVQPPLQKQPHLFRSPEEDFPSRYYAYTGQSSCGISYPAPNNPPSFSLPLPSLPRISSSSLISCSFAHWAASAAICGSSMILT